MYTRNCINIRTYMCICARVCVMLLAAERAASDAWKRDLKPHFRSLSLSLSGLIPCSFLLRFLSSPAVPLALY